MYNTYVKGVQKNPFFSFLAFNMWFLVVCRKKKLINTPPKTKSETTQRWEKIYSGGRCVQ